MQKRAILHIPDSEMLSTQPIKYWISSFENQARVRPTEVALPAVGYSGPTFDSKVHGYPNRLRPGNLMPDWVRQVRDVLGNDVPIWASFLPQFPFIKIETLMVSDQYGERFDSNACITNPTVQRITHAFLSEIAEFGVHGIVFDLTDIYPNSGSNAMRGLRNSCFCNYCLKELELAGWKRRQRPFIGVENISRFVLQLTETGARFIEPRHQWIRDLDVGALLQFSEARGFVTEKDNTADDAEELLRYLAIRARVTAESVRSLGAPMRERQLSVAAILGDEHFDMSQGGELDSLSSAEAATEFWLPMVNGEFSQAKGLNVVQYLFGRATYGLNAFFEGISGADDYIAGGGVESFISRLLRQSRMTQSNKLNPGAVFAVGLSDEYSGFVGVPIGRSDIVGYIEGLTSGTLGQLVPRNLVDQIIDQVKLATPERTR